MPEYYAKLFTADIIRSECHLQMDVSVTRVYEWNFRASADDV